MLSSVYNTATGLLTSVTSRLPASVLNNIERLRNSRRLHNGLAVVGGKLVAARDTSAGKWVEGTIIVKRAKDWFVQLWVWVFCELCAWLEWIRAQTSTTVGKITGMPRATASAANTAVNSAVARIMGTRTAAAAPSPASLKTEEASYIVEHDDALPARADESIAAEETSAVIVAAPVETAVPSSSGASSPPSSLEEVLDAPVDAPLSYVAQSYATVLSPPAPDAPEPYTASLGHILDHVASSASSSAASDDEEENTPSSEENDESAALDASDASSLEASSLEASSLDASMTDAPVLACMLASPRPSNDAASSVKNSPQVPRHPLEERSANA